MPSPPTARPPACPHGLGTSTYPVGPPVSRSIPVSYTHLPLPPPSLVGSEMCIRDSVGDVKHAVAADGKAAGMPARARHIDISGRTTRLEIDPCILYPSDAADDLL